MTDEQTTNRIGENTLVLGGLLLVGGLIALGVFGFRAAKQGATESKKRNQARALVTRWAEQLDAQTTPTGVYIRHEGETLPEQDPWGNPLRVQYKQGGVAETVTVRSAGPDGTMFTDDDFVEERMAANFKGVGDGIKKNAAEVAGNTMKGAVKGTVEGIKNVFHKKKNGDAAPNDEEAAAETE